MEGIKTQKKEAAPESLLEKAEKIFYQDEINEDKVFSFLREFIASEEKNGYVEGSEKIVALFSAKDPNSESDVNIASSEKQGWKKISTGSWEKAFLLGIIPWEEVEIPEFCLNSDGEMTEKENPFFENIKKLNEN